MTKDNRDNVDEVEDALKKKNLKPAFFFFFFSLKTSHSTMSWNARADGWNPSGRVETQTTRLLNNLHVFQKPGYQFIPSVQIKISSFEGF